MAIRTDMTSQTAYPATDAPVAEPVSSGGGIFVLGLFAALALWGVLAILLYAAMRYSFGLPAGDAWAFGAGIGGYITLFTSFVLGLVYLLTGESHAAGA